MRDLSKAILALGQERPLSAYPCTVTSVSPLVVDLLGVSTPAVKIAGLTYSTGPAIALVSSPGTPIILPIG